MRILYFIVFLCALWAGCSEPKCGDGIVDVSLNEECDDGNSTNADGCQAGCLLPRCGDGTIDPSAAEECDDGNSTDSDGCNSDCSLTAVVQVVGGNFHTCALLNTGSVRCWGDHSSGKLGYGERGNVGDDETPVSVGDINLGGKVTLLAAGPDHTCALLDTGGVRCWGNGEFGRLGYGNNENIGDDEFPFEAGDVNVGGTVVQLTAGGFHTCALLDTGDVRCWGGSNDPNVNVGQLGYGNLAIIGDNESPASAGDVNVGGAVKQISAGFRHTCALLTTGAVRCWGNAASGQLGYGNTDNIGDNENPVQAGDVNIGATVSQLVVSSDNSCVMLNTGAIRCWGRANEGQPGHANTNNIGDEVNETPADAGDATVGEDVVQLSVGGLHICALLDTGKVRCWGTGSSGRLGYGNTETIGDNEFPSNAGEVNIGGTVDTINAFGTHTCAILDTGKVRCWGNAASGQLGYGNTNDIGDSELPSDAGDVPIF